MRLQWRKGAANFQSRRPAVNERHISHSWRKIREPGSKLPVLGMVIESLVGNPYNGYINPYYWVDDHPLLYGINGSLDPSTRGCPAGFVIVTSCCCKLVYN